MSSVRLFKYKKVGKFDSDGATKCKKACFGRGVIRYMKVVNMYAALCLYVLPDVSLSTVVGVNVGAWYMLY